MIQNIYTQDPNQYIKSLSKIQKDITKMVSSQIKNDNQQNLDNQIHKQLSKNFLKYKKNLLIQARMQFCKKRREEIQKSKKQHIKEMIQAKIKQSISKKQQNQIQFIERKKQQRIIKQRQIQMKKMQIRKQKISQSLDLIQKIQKKRNTKNQTPIILKLLQEKQKMDRIARQKNKRQRNKKNRFQDEKNPQVIYSTMLQLYESAILLTQIQHNPQFQLPQKNPQQDFIKSLSKSKSSKSCSLPQLRLDKLEKLDLQKKQQLVKKIIQQKQNQGYQQWVEKNSLAYKATNNNKNKLIKQVIEKYLKSSGTEI